MIYVGIDIAKLNHFASAISSDGEELIKPFKFTNDNDGFQLLISKLDPLDKDSLIIGLESTAHYGDNLVRYLVAKNYKVCVLNPIKTSKRSQIYILFLILSNLNFTVVNSISNEELLPVSSSLQPS